MHITTAYRLVVAWGPVSILKERSHERVGTFPIRQLMHKAAAAVQALKPLVMMSPLSMAQCLPQGKLTFDLLVMDEASQIQPVDALGAIARCRQVVVVGDERQLPPTRCFSKLTSDVDDDVVKKKVRRLVTSKVSLDCSAHKACRSACCAGTIAAASNDSLPSRTVSFNEDNLPAFPKPAED